MPYIKIADLAVRVEKYSANGQDRFKYSNVGTILQDETGREMFLLNRTFNPAGALNLDGRSQVVIYRFESEANSERKRDREYERSVSSTPLDDIPF